jgi:CBS domain-containing protein
MSRLSSTVEEELARIAGAAHGLVTRSELLLGGVTDDEIRWRLRKGGLIRVHRGIYRVGHRAPSTEATYLAAVLAAGEGALLNGRAAAHLFVLTKGAAPAPEVIARTQRRIEGVTTHRSHSLSARDGTTFRGIPVTTVPRTLIDIAADLSIEHSQEPATRPGSATAPRRKPSRPRWREGRPARAPKSSAESSTETSTSPSASSRLIS